MENFLNGGIEELEAAKRAIIEEAEKNLASDSAKSALNAKEKELNAQKQFMSDKIESTIKNRRSELEKKHDAKIKEAERDVKEARKNKKDALSKDVNKRVKSENAFLAGENKKLKKENARLFKAAKIPGFCNTRLYYALFVPRSGLDFLLFAFSVIIAVVLIPNIVCYFLSLNTFYKIIVYLAIVVFFALIYFLVTIWTKSGEKGAVIEQGRPNMKAVKENKKAMKKQEKEIRKDEDETRYGLEDYDSEIDRRQEVFAAKNRAKENELRNFDVTVSVQIKHEIEDELVPKIEQLAKEADNLRNEYNIKNREAEEATEALNTNYAVYLTPKYTTCEKIDELISVINEGKASNVGQALEVIKGGVR